MKLDRERVDRAFSKVQLWVGLPVIAFALIYPVIDGQWAFWVPLTMIAGLAVMGIIQLYPQWLRGEEMFIAIIVWVAVGMATNGITVKVAYYQAIAQILPVLFLALVVERRLRVSRRPEIRSRVIVIAAYAMALAEYYALRVISDPGTTANLPSRLSPPAWPWRRSLSFYPRWSRTTLRRTATTTTSGSALARVQRDDHGGSRSSETRGGDQSIGLGQAGSNSAAKSLHTRPFGLPWRFPPKPRKGPDRGRGRRETIARTIARLQGASRFRERGVAWLPRCR